jgi:hypothetical protein
MTTSTQNIASESNSSLNHTPSLTLPSPPRKLDEAYLEIQKRLEEKDVAFKREGFVYLYIIIVLFDGLILSIADIKAFAFFAGNSDIGQELLCGRTHLMRISS